MCRLTTCQHPIKGCYHILYNQKVPRVRLYTRHHVTKEDELASISDRRIRPATLSINTTQSTLLNYACSFTCTNLYQIFSINIWRQKQDPREHLYFSVLTSNQRWHVVVRPLERTKQREPTSRINREESRLTATHFVENSGPQQAKLLYSIAIHQRNSLLPIPLLLT